MAKKRKSGGKHRGRGGKSFQSNRSRPTPTNDSSPLFSLRDAVYNTARGDHSWSRDTRLRSRGITFVSAGNLTGTLPQQDGEENSDDEDEFNVDFGFEDQVEEELESEDTDADRIDVLEMVTQSEEPAVTQSSNGIAKLSLDKTTISPPSSSPSPPPFVIDTTPSHPSNALLQMAPPRLRNHSPAPSDSSDEVVFRGRNAPRVVADPIIPSASTPSRPQSALQSAETGDSRSDPSRTVTVTTNTAGKGTVPRPPRWDQFSVPWEHRSKPSIGWLRPETYGEQELVAENRRLRQVEEEEALDDYIANLHAHQMDSDLAENTVQEATRGEVEAVVNAQEEQMLPGEHVPGPHFDSTGDNGGGDTDEDASEVEGEEDEENEEDGDEFDEDTDEDDLSFDSHDDMLGNKDSVERRIARMTDEQIARLLAKQEELGLGSEELLIFDDSDGDVGLDGASDSQFALPQIPAAGSRGQVKRGKKKQTGHFPSASLLADVLDQDPYNGFDIMNWDRPSLKPKKKGRKLEDDVFGDLDDELKASIRTTWEKDRETKRLKKAERAELRAQGLLGRGKRGKPDLSVKYEDGMSLASFRDELRQFLSSSSEHLALPPMDKHLRKGIHEIAMEFGLKSKSIGSGKNRYPKLMKTRNTIPFDDEIWGVLQNSIDRGFFKRLERRSNNSAGKASKRMTRGGGAAMAGVRYMDGEIVGAAAPEIGIENRGRAMLEKMGWSKGMALGTATNQGILHPIAHTVKISKAGLG